MNIGQLVKDRRKDLNLTQIELAKDICTQAMVSKIEKGIINPSSQLLKEISDRLNVPVSYFYKDDEDRHLEKIEKDILSYLNQNELEKAGELLKKYKEKFLRSKNEYYHLFYQMIEIYTDYDEHKNSDDAIEAINKLLDKLTHRPLLHLDSLGLLAIVYYDSERYEEAHEVFQELLSLMNEQTKLSIRIRVLYNYALNLESLGKDEEALEVIIQSIDESIKKQSLYNLGNLFYYKAFLLNKKKDYKKAKEDFENAAFVFKIQNYQKMLDQTKNKLQEVNSLLENNN